MASLPAHSGALWKHPYVASTNIDAFRHYVNREFHLDLRTYYDLHQWSVTEIPDFARACWIFCGIRYSVAPTTWVTGVQQMWPPPKWFPGARLNFTENLLSPGLCASPQAVAITVLRESSTVRVDITWHQLERRVAQWVALLRELGVAVGDRVAGRLTHDKSDSIRYKKLT